MTAEPAELELAAGRSTLATALVTNTGDVKLSHLHLRAVPTGSAPVTVTIAPAAAPTLKPGETRVYLVRLAPWEAARSPSPLSLLATYRAPDGTREATAASLKLTPPAPLDLAKLASVEAKASLATLRSGETDPVYLLVKNSAAQTLTVSSVQTEGPDFIEFEKPGPTSVPPGGTATLVLQAKADDTVKPGEHQLVFTLKASLGGADFDLVAAQTAKVGVAGEAELLTVLGIPSVLLLPGFLVIATASLLWRLRFRRREWDGDAFPFSVKEAEFWLLAVLFSIAGVGLASLGGIDLLGRYSLEDLLIVWGASVLVGAALYVVVIEIRNRQRASRVPAAGDQPLDVLRKLAKQGLGLRLPLISLDVDGTSADRFLVQPLSESRPATWASPRIEYEWSGLKDPGLDRRIRAQLDETYDAAALAGILADGEARKLLTVSFEGQGGQGSLAPVEKAKIGRLNSDVIVRGKT